MRPLGIEDKHWLPEFWREHWGEPTMVIRGVVYRAVDLPGIAAEAGGALVGLVVYDIRGETCEIISLDSLQPGRGIGSALVAAVRAEAQRSGCTRLVVVTTNDNTHALCFYQRLGFVLVELRRDAVTAARQIKPSIPFYGEDGILIRDELELALPLSG